MAKKQISTYKFVPGAVPPAYNQFPNAVSLLVANRAFLLEEISEYITQEIAASNPIYAGYTYDTTRQQKCKRDVGYILDGFIYDLTYGGNTLTYQVASRFFVNGILQIIQPAVEIDVKTWLLGKITTNILPEVTYTPLNATLTQSTITGSAEVGADAVITTLMGHITAVITNGLSSLPTPIIPNQQGGGLMPNTVALLELNKRFIQEETIAYIQYNVDNNNPPYTFYTYNAAKCRRDISYVLEGYLTDLKNGGNRQTVFNSEKYFENGVPQVDGDRQPEIFAHTFIRNLIQNYILPNISFASLQTTVGQTINNSFVAESTAYVNVAVLADTVINVITYGLDELPASLSNRGSIKMPGFYKLKDILLISNASRNVILYNFADPTTPAEVTYSENFDSDFPGALYGNDKITTITLNLDTTGMMVTDNIQIFVEGKEQLVRLNPIANDAMERMKVGIPQSMLDADFEYGLQPTKWQAISMMRNYPSIYEIPGSDIAVLSVTTDASTGTSGIGASQLTVVTQSSNGLAVGDPITIKALANSISGFSRAEGSFLVATIVSPNSFTYFAKSKVGTSNGQQLSSTYTQLRRGGFYTGSAVGNPSFSVFSSGSSGTITTSLATAAGSDVIGFTGTIPPIGAPISGTGINSGAQITAVTGTGGVVVTATLTVGAEIGDTTLTVDSTFGISAGLVFDRGDGQSVTVTDITGNIVTLGGALTSAVGGSTETYTSVPTTGGLGTSASFNITRSGSSYSSVIASPGSGYEADDELVAVGSLLGGVDSTNDATITVLTASLKNTVATLDNATLTPGSGYTTSSGVSTTIISGTGTGLTVNIVADGASGVASVVVNTSGQNYSSGTLVSIDNGLNGSVLTFDTGTLDGGTGQTTRTNVTTFGGSGTGLTVNVTANGSGIVTAVVPNQRGSGYLNNETIYIAPLANGKVLTLNNTTLSGGGGFTAGTGVITVGAGTGLTVDTTVVGGVITAIAINNPGTGYAAGNVIIIPTTVAGVVLGFDTGSIFRGRGQTARTNVFTTGGLGGGLSVDVTVNAFGLVDTVTVNNAGTGYSVGDTISIPPPVIGDVRTVGNIVAGTGYISGTNRATTTTGSGTGLTLDVTANAGGITAVTINARGSGYVAGDSIVISGGTGGRVNVFTVSADATINISSVTANATIEVATVATIAAINIDTVVELSTIEIGTTNPGGAIQTISVTGTPISSTPVDFISAFTISESTNASIANASSITFSAISTIQIAFNSPHGFIPGNTITTQITSAGAGAQLAAGPFFVEQVPTATTLRYTARTSGAIANTLTGVVYGRPDSFFVHRPFDGGVQLGTASPSHGAVAIRMSKKYIRYQSGKGVMYNTGALFAPSYDLRSLTATGTGIGSIITVTTDDTDHGLQVGGIITITGVLTSGFDGLYTVTDIVTERVFRVISQKILGNATATLGTPCYMSVRKWHGSTIRAGIFDDQNGMFYQYDGQRMAVVKRSSTNQIAGTISVAANSNSITGENTRFSQQLAQGDRIVIRGMSHVVSQVISDTSMSVTPDFRGVNDVVGAKCVKTIDLVIPQEDWNIDPMNGSGPSGYNLDVTKMQMIGIQHTWYGAGFIDFMLRGPEGNYIFAHRIRNSNVNSEAYMRTGNQPVRYEVCNEGARGVLASAMDASQTTIPLTPESAYYFPTAGTVIVDNELIRYTGNNGTSLTGCVRAASLTQFTAGAQRTFTGGVATSHISGAGAVLVSNTITPNISHWGSAFLIDGQFDSDRGYIFNYAATAVSTSLEKVTAFLIRLAPSVSNAQIGDLGDKELLNRAQLLLSSISISSDPVSSADPFVGNQWSSGGAATSGLYYHQTSAGVKNWYLATSTGTFSSTAPTFTSGTGASGTFGVNLTWAGATPNNDGAIVIEGVLNPANYPTDPTKITWTGLSSSAAGGQPSFAQIASGGSVTWSGGASTSNATVQGAFTNTLTAKSFAAATANLTAISFNSVAQTAVATSFAPGTSGTYNSALSTSRLDFLIPQSALNSLNASTTVVAGDSVLVTGSGNLANVVMARADFTGSLNGTTTITYTGGVFPTVGMQLTNPYGASFNQNIYITNIVGNAITVSAAINFNSPGFAFQLQGRIFTCTSTTLALNQRIQVSGTTGGSFITGWVNGATYYVVATNGSTNFILTSTPSSTVAVSLVGGTNNTSVATTGSTFTLSSFISTSRTITNITQNFTTLASVVYARIELNLPPTDTSWPSSVNGGNNVTVQITSSNAARYNSAISAARTDFLITQTQFASVTLTAADLLSATTFITGGQTISSATGNFAIIGGVAYAQVNMTSVGSSSSTAGAGNNVSVTSTSSATALYGSALRSTRSDFLITNASFAGTGIAIGDTLSLATFLTGGQTITGITPSYISIGGVLHTRIVMSANANSTSTSGAAQDQTVTVTAAGTAAAYDVKNFLFFTSSSWLASGAAVGTKISINETGFPAGTSVAQISTRTFGATTVYRVTFTQTSNTTTLAGDEITFQFGAQYALPGEQVFSFITNPGNTEKLDLVELKELTATAIGGRGTFPNGPDVLAINVYKVSGAATPSNVILRWGEAQA
jgi:hypothetical protein